MLPSNVNVARSHLIQVDVIDRVISKSNAQLFRNIARPALAPADHRHELAALGALKGGRNPVDGKIASADQGPPYAVNRRRYRAMHDGVALARWSLHHTALSTSVRTLHSPSIPRRCCRSHRPQSSPPLNCHVPFAGLLPALELAAVNKTQYVYDTTANRY